MSSPEQRPPLLGRLHVGGAYLQSFKVVDHDFVVVTTTKEEDALTAPCLYLIAIGSFLQTLDHEVFMEELPLKPGGSPV